MKIGIAFVASVAVALVVAACSPVGPSSQFKEVFSGTVEQRGDFRKTFSVGCSGASTSCEYQINLTSMTPDPSVQVQLSLATADCRQTINAALVVAGQAGLAGTNMTSGTYCVAVIDVGYLTRSESIIGNFTHPQ